MDKHTTEIATQVADIVSKSGLTPFEIELMFRDIRGNLTIGGYRPFTPD